MNGDNIVLDTSLIINLFNGSHEIESLLVGKNLFVSIISEIELLSFASLSTKDKQLLKRFLSECFIIDIEPGIKDQAIQIRIKNKIKLPDAVIAATAIYYDLPLLTMDKGFKKIDRLNVTVLFP